MPQHITRIGKGDRIHITLPKKEHTWLNVHYGGGSDQIWIDLDSAFRLRDALSQTLAALPTEQSSESTE